MTRPSFDLVHAPACCVSAFLEGRTWGRVETWPEAFEAGRLAERDEATTLQRTVIETVHRLAELDERDRATDQARAEVRRTWWARRRGEGAA